jgi:hypothetical protein
VLAYSVFWWLLVIVPTIANWLLAHYELATSGNFEPHSPLRASAYNLMIVATTPVLIKLAQRLSWPALRAAVLPAWLLFGLTTLGMLGALYSSITVPAGEVWFAYAALWLLSEWLMRGTKLGKAPLVLLHTLRSTGPSGFRAGWKAAAPILPGPTSCRPG